MLLKKFSFLSILFFISSSSLAVDYMIEPDALIHQQPIPHGEPVHSVAWCCNPSYPNNKYAAIGGILGTGGAYVRVYKLNRNKHELEQKATLPGSEGLPENYVNSVDWCCRFDGGDPALAVGGADGMVHVFAYRTSADTLDYQATFTHGAEIHAVSWLCDCCNHNYLAIAGEAASDNRDIRILYFDAGPPAQLIEVDNYLHGNTVFSLDWCCVDIEEPVLDKAYLAAAGKPSALGGSDCCGPNLRVFCLQCATTGTDATFIPVTSEAVTCTYLRAVRWCGCNDPNIKYPKLAVGGVPVNGTSGNNAWLYYLVNSRKLVQVAATTVAGVSESGELQEGLRIFALDWNPSCQCTHLTFGGGCQPTDPCFKNLLVYKQNKCTLNRVLQQRYDDNVTSLEWCYDNGISYLLVGTMINNWGGPDMCEEGVAEAMLYMAAFCKPQALPICMRMPW